MPSNKIVKKLLPEKDQLMYWMNVKTGEKVFDKAPCNKIPLNPDAYFIPPEYKKGEESRLIETEYSLDRENIRNLCSKL